MKSIKLAINHRHLRINNHQVIGIAGSQAQAVKSDNLFISNYEMPVQASMRPARYNKTRHIAAIDKILRNDDISLSCKNSNNLPCPGLNARPLLLPPSTKVKSSLALACVLKPRKGCQPSRVIWYML